MTSLRLAVPAALLAGLALLPSASAATAARTQDVTWHGTQIHLYDAEAAGHDGAGVTVAVLDSWIDTTHPDFENRAVGAVDCVGGTCRPGQVRDSCTHGTHVAGTVGSTSFGVARKAIIMPVQVLTADSQNECTGTPGDVAAGIRYAVAHGAQVLNLSLGPDVTILGTTSAIPAAVHAAAAAGVVVIFSAGNADNQTAQSYGSDALVVAATGPNGHLASYSQHGAGISVAAPGGQPTSSDTCNQDICITSLYPKGAPGCAAPPCYAVAAGTSMAAPHVAGLAALLLGQNPKRGRQNVMDRITGTARPLAGGGAGLIDAKAALGVTTTTPKPTATTRSVPVVRTRTTPPKPATAKPTPTKAKPSRTALPTASPVPLATPSATASPLAAAPRALPASRQDDVPVPLAAFAGILVGLAAAGVLTLPRYLKR